MWLNSAGAAPLRVFLTTMEVRHMPVAPPSKTEMIRIDERDGIDLSDAALDVMAEV